MEAATTTSTSRQPEPFATAMPKPDRRDVWRVGALIVDGTRFEARRGGAPIPVQPRVFRFLLCVARRGGTAVANAELIEEVWDGAHVDASAVRQCAKKARELLGAEYRSFLQTIRGYGYRLDCTHPSRASAARAD